MWTDVCNLSSAGRHVGLLSTPRCGRLAAPGLPGSGDNVCPSRGCLCVGQWEEAGWPSTEPGQPHGSWLLSGKVKSCVKQMQRLQSSLLPVLLGIVCPLSQNHSMVGVGRDLWGPSPTPCPSRVTQSRLHSTAARQGWNISREGDSTASLGSLVQGSVTLRVKKFFLHVTWDPPVPHAQLTSHSGSPPHQPPQTCYDSLTPSLLSPCLSQVKQGLSGSSASSQVWSPPPHCTNKPSRPSGTRHGASLSRTLRDVGLCRLQSLCSPSQELVAFFGDWRRCRVRPGIWPCPQPVLAGGVGWEEGCRACTQQSRAGRPSRARVLQEGAARFSRSGRPPRALRGGSLVAGEV